MSWVFFWGVLKNSDRDLIYFIKVLKYVLKIKLRLTRSLYGGQQQETSFLYDIFLIST